MRVERVELHQVRMRLAAPFETSLGVTLDRDAILVHLLADGLEGWGECVAGRVPDYSYETTSTAWQVLGEFLLPALLGREIGEPAAVAQAFAPFRGHPMAKAAVETAVWDLLARGAGQSLAQFLGGRGERVKVGVSVGIQPSTEKLVALVQEFVRAGYARIKLKIKPGRDLEDVRAVRRAMPSLNLQVDANSAYTLDDAPLFKAMDEFDLLMIEQPLGREDLLDHSRLQAQLRTAICLDESILDLSGTRSALDLGSCRVVNIKPGRVGGLLESRRIHDECQQRGVPVWCGGMLETGVGRAANVALATLPNFKLPGDLSASRRYYAEDLIEEPFELNPDSTLSVPRGPGIGVHLRQEALARVTLRKALFRA